MSQFTQDTQEWVIRHGEEQDEADWQAFIKDFYGNETKRMEQSKGESKAPVRADGHNPMRTMWGRISAFIRSQIQKAFHNDRGRVSGSGSSLQSLSRADRV